MIVQIKRSHALPLRAGLGEPTRVMALIGANRVSDLSAQEGKIRALMALDEPPDIVADLSLVRMQQPLWLQAAKAGLAAAALPVYLTRPRNARIDPLELIDVVAEMIEGGIGLLTIHPTASIERVELARNRMVPWTSRGGGLVIEDMLATRSAENVYLRVLPDIVRMAARCGVVLSLGATFRSANVFDSLDRAQISEIEAQISLAREIARQGVGVVIESPGHAKPSDIKRVAVRLRESAFPVMPLGPIPTDVAIGFDHVAAAIGATLMGLEGAAHILAAVTREEHTGGIPSCASTLEAVRTARIAAHVLDVELLGILESDMKIARERGENRTCVVGKESRGCSRCGKACPL